MQQDDRKITAGSLAQFVVESDKLRAGFAKKHPRAFDGRLKLAETTAFLSHMAGSLKKVGATIDDDVKLYSYDAGLFALIDKLEELETEDILGMLPKAHFPFDRMWIEGPNPFPSLDSDLRWGALVTANADKGEFSFQYVLERRAGIGSAITRPPANQMVLVQDGRYLDIRPTVITASSDTIHLEEDKLMEIMGWAQHHTSKDATGLVDEIFRATDCLARLFLVLGSEHIKNNFALPHTQGERERHAKNRSRIGMRREPVLAPRSITVDITATHAKLLAPRTAKEARQLLGITSVERSKPIISKTGVVFTRKPHERRIARAVDLRRTQRDLTVGRPVDIQIGENGRPVQIPDHSKPELGRPKA